jgi:hypothetical protein
MTVRDTLMAATQNGDPLDQALFTLLINSFAVLDDGLATDAEVAAAYQPLLVSGTNIKTINGIALPGSGNIVISGGGSLVDAQITGAWRLDGGYGDGGMRAYADSGTGIVGVRFFNYFGNAVGTIVATNGGTMIIASTLGALGLGTTLQYGRIEPIDANGGSNAQPLFVLDGTSSQEGGFYCQRTGGEANIQKWCSGRVDRVALDRTGNLEFKSGTTIVLNPAASVTPAANGNLVIQATSNTSLAFKLRGSDGVVRSGSIALS